MISVMENCVNPKKIMMDTYWKSQFVTVSKKEDSTKEKPPDKIK